MLQDINMARKFTAATILLFGIVALSRGFKKDDRHSRNLAPNLPDDPRFLLENLKKVSEALINGEPLTLLQNPYALNPSCRVTSPFREIDGTCNNLENPYWGAAKTPLPRILPTNNYEDGIQKPTKTAFVSKTPFPPARKVSSSVHATTSNLSRVHSHLLMNYGQFLDHDMTFSPEAGFEGGAEPGKNLCCQFTEEELENAEGELAECINLNVEGDAIFNRSCIPLLRSAVTPAFPGKDEGIRFQLQDLTSFVDGSNVYGSTNRRAVTLRTGDDGKLKVSTGLDGLSDLPADPANPDNCFNNEDNEECVFTSGDIRNSEQAGLASVHTLFLREHNRICEVLKDNFFRDETAYQNVRKIVGAIIQKITYGEWLPEVIGEDMMNKFGLNLLESGRFTGYDPTVNPSVLNEFSTAAFRFGHSLLRQTFGVGNEQIDITQFFAAFEVVKEHGTSSILNGLSTDNMEFRERFITDGLRNHLFDQELDLSAFNIQRSREHGLGSYNDIRKYFELKVATSFDDLIGSTHLAEAIDPLKVYADVGDMEIFPAGLAEVPLKDAVVGETFANIIAEQFRRAKIGDRFWFETNDPVTGFTDAQLNEIRKVNFASLYCQNVANPIVRPRMLLAESDSNPRVDCSIIPQMDLSVF